MDQLGDAPALAVVLGGGAIDGRAAPATAARAHRAAQLAHERQELVFIASGDRAPNDDPGTPSEASLIRDLMLGSGVSPGRIVLEDESLDTIGNAVLVAIRYLGALEPRPLAVITSPFHLERATETFRHVLGHRWQLEAIAADETDDDIARAPRETGYLQETTVFFANLRPGDLRAIARRLRDRPGYATLARLQG